MKLSQFSIEVPEKLIASYPCENRDESRLMVLHRATGKIEHKCFKDIIDYFQQGDVIALNDTKVFNALLLGTKEKTNAKVEVTLLRKLSETQHIWDTLVEPARKIRIGNRIYFGNEELVAEVLDNTTSRGRTLNFLFNGTDEELLSIIDNIGHVPIPSIIKRKPEILDRQRYQTVYAQKQGATVAPYAGLHFSHQLLKRLELKGIDITQATLFISINLFNVIEMEDLSKCKTDSEFCSLEENTAQLLNNAVENGKQICAVGVSTARALESFVSFPKKVKSGEKWTNFSPLSKQQFKICTSLVTNFHLQKTSPLVHAFAFGGQELMLEAYHIAIKEKYKFFVYGDSMLII